MRAGVLFEFKKLTMKTAVANPNAPPLIEDLSCNAAPITGKEMLRCGKNPPIQHRTRLFFPSAR